MTRGEGSTDDQWALLEPLLPKLPLRGYGSGRPWRSQREVLGGVLWILRSSTRWHNLPGRFPPYGPAAGAARARYIQALSVTS